MRARLKLAMSIVVLALAIGMFSRFLGWMNQPSDSWFYAGLVGAVSCMAFVPALLALIWRPEMVRQILRRGNRRGERPAR